MHIDGQKVDFQTNHEGQLKVTKDVQKLRSALPMVFQGFNLWQHLSVLENVAIAPIHVLGRNKQAAKERAEELLVRVGLGERMHYYPPPAFRRSATACRDCACFGYGSISFAFR